MGSLNENVVHKKIESLQPTQENIETVSLWCLHHKDYHSMIVNVWFKCFKTVTLKQRLSLIYLANDVCQRERQKKFKGFRKSFATVLKEAVTIIRSDEIKSNVERIVDIWIDRDIFEGNLANELKEILQNSLPTSNNEKNSLSTVNEKWLAEFKLDSLIAELEKQKSEKQSLQRAQGLLPSVPFNGDGNVKSYLKDRHEGVKYAKEIDLAHKKLSDFVVELERHLQGQSRLIGLLEQSKLFYETQLSEATVVETAYRKFGSGVQSVKQELDKMKVSGLFPPNNNSPLVDAPSPTANDDPFAQGVEAVVAGVKRRTFDRNEPVDMDLDEEGTNHAPTTSRTGKSFEAALEGLKFATNQSFLPSNSTSNGRLAAEKSQKYAKYEPTSNETHSVSSNWTNNQFHQSDNAGNWNKQTSAYVPHANQASASSQGLSNTPPRHQSVGPPPFISRSAQPMTTTTHRPPTLPPFDVTLPPPRLPQPAQTGFNYGARLPQGNPSAQFPSPSKISKTIFDQPTTSNQQELDSLKQFPVPAQNRGGINQRNLTVLSGGGETNSNDNRFRSPPPNRFQGVGQSLLGSVPPRAQFPRPSPPPLQRPQSFPQDQRLHERF